MNTEELKESVKYFKCSKDKMIIEFANCKELKPLISCAESVLQVEGLSEKKDIKIKGLQGQMKEGEKDIDCSDYPRGMKNEVLAHYQTGYIRGLSIGIDLAINDCALIIARDYVKKSSLPSYQQIKEVSAQGYCTKRNENKELDGDLLEDVSYGIYKLITGE